MSIYDDIRKNARDYSPTKSAQWFNSNVRNFAANKNVGPMKLLGAGIKLQEHSPTIGNMYMFTYSAKHKDTLPYYDKFPMVFPFSINPKGFHGLNLHYLPPNLRLKLLDRLLVTLNNDRLTDHAKLVVSWKLLRSVAKFPEVGPCVKQYLFSHVKSMYLKVLPKDWAMAIFLPVERFTVSNKTVWDVSRGMI